MSKLKELLNAGTLIQAPGAADALTARLVEQAGFPAVYMTGFGATATTLGMPDLGLMTQTEMLEHARRMVRATALPVIADADTGYGGINNLLRTVEDYAQIGVAAIHLEDQTLPKRCGQLSGIQLVDAEAQVRTLKGAVCARAWSDMLLIARTDALGVHGVEEAVRRANLYAETGVDLVFVDGVKTIAQAEAIARHVPGRKVLSVVDGNETQRLTAAEIQQMGFDIVFYALSTLFAAAKASARVLEVLRHDGSTAAISNDMATYGEFMEMVGLHRYHDFEKEFGQA
ncbi:isocitrate lyase/PEP mutase family protein [Pseudomonas sp. S 311-6]|jgi:2-methylisocitrate lyase-like PEP mutase family enzyme|uniref:2,3-dimethylmalate lyase n=2 Tax=Kerstersia gyiorum TaxID=206506 RepID=A0A171KQC5_9BURK|nr:isocitrate lyase/PEP mutase family protein [Kerstersia gyiorum]AZV92464.1 2,3-dimethylmalate lyase [Bordetella sp. J329]MCO7642469.1 isocitrate lyase/PEP mutase family protein [Pseudomonas sp. S 311-6]KAB0543882.1 isocitrate lyase/PEP mutase family protein [Kerstersia gyiorum]KKO71092.1 2,3-dimethylmalate lyase [Kerstersia gyiorum]MCH4270174.1 isocitrate lyase/PEP mutase family protein [Kerstersia gyiorum]